MSIEPLSDSAIEQALGNLPHWTRDGETLTRTFKFSDFRAAMGFMVRVGFEADAANHHPDWSNVYNRVVVRLSTHDAGNSITAKDVALAEAMDGLV
jgi:4a-hydroxytetrahydrobiopterin dehydratase